MSREQIEALAKVMNVHVRRDECGDYCIVGQRGNIHVDGNAYSIAIWLPTKKQYGFRKVTLIKFCELRQDGDTEGVFYLSRMPTHAQAVALRSTLRIKKIKEFDDATLEKMRTRMAALRSA